MQATASEAKAKFVEILNNLQLPHQLTKYDAVYTLLCAALCEAGIRPSELDFANCLMSQIVQKCQEQGYTLSDPTCQKGCR